jgi:acyl-CoA reductase-like NAD-dependent aldehyde dehydrogenase
MQTFKFLIGGKLVDGAQTMTVINPATEQPVAIAPRASAAQMNEAVAAAKAAQPAWAAKSVAERRKVLLQVADVVEKNAGEIAKILTAEQGKPLMFATGEAMGLANFFRYFSNLDLEVKVIEDSETKRVEMHRRPLGVVVAIVPWNFPVALLGSKLPTALIAGNTVVVKPAATTPLSTLFIGELIKDIVPPGVINIVADANDLGDVLTSHPDVRKVSFTGSTATGKRVMACAAGTLKRLTLELGGNDAGIVLDDADPKTVAPGIFMGAFFNSGQVCIALKRLYVHEKIYDAVVNELVQLANNATVGDGTKEGTMFGPLQNKMQYEKVKGFIEDGRKSGKIVAGGEPVAGPGYFVRPTIVRDIKDGARLVDEEQFGPVLPVIKYSNLDDAVNHANASVYGLGGSVWSSNVERATAVASRLECGTAWVNKHCEIAPNIPFGGAKSSGMGVELSADGLDEFTQVHVLSVAKPAKAAAKAA